MWIGFIFEVAFDSRNRLHPREREGLLDVLQDHHHLTFSKSAQKVHIVHFEIESDPLAPL
jgi:hypothetical protein